MPANLFDVNFYRAANTDLANLNNTQALSHFQNYGLNEGRTFSPFADLNFYRSSNSDLASFNNQQAFEHLQNYGINEGRRFSQFADLNFYRASNSDLASLNNEQIFEHLQNNGINEGRRFSQFADLNFYRASNSDLASLNNSQALQHLKIHGLKEGRSFSQFFDVKYYRDNNSDLLSLGLNQSQLLEHFEIYGLGEERRFSIAFDVNYYRNANSDLASANLDSKKLYEHFQLYGLAEGRPSSPSFNISSYRASKPELANLNNYQLYEYSIIYDQREGGINNGSDGTNLPPNPGSFNIQFDYRFDTNVFFTPERQAVLEAAANIWENIIKDEFANLPIGTNLYVSNPQTNTAVEFLSNYEIDDLVVFVGARSIDGSGGTLAEGGSSAIYYRGSSLDNRYNSSNNFEPWTGSISFDISDSWFFDTTPNTSNDIPRRSIDFLSVAVHELGHVLGIGGSKAFENQIIDGFFYGSNAVALNSNNPIPLDDGLGHVEKGFLINGVGSEALMSPSITSGTRKLPTPLDVAILADIGYRV